MTPVLRVVSAGHGCTVQDGGRHGFLRYGVTAAGPMDPLAHAIANHALGNSPDQAAVEISLGGIEIGVEAAPVTIAVAGGSFAVFQNGQELPPAVVATVEPGSTLRLRAGQSGVWAYLAVAGGLNIPLALGSASTHTRTGLGGVEGRQLRADDRMSCSELRRGLPESGRIIAPMLDRPIESIRVILGPQDDYFSSDQIAKFLQGPWSVSTRSDRMAYFLEGPTLSHSRGYNIVSDGIVMGAVQVPGEGRPIVLMADRQPTGGYPKIATVIGPDQGRLAQIRPGEEFCFRPVTHAEAVSARAEERDFLSRPCRVEPLIRTTFSPEFLLGLNLIDGCVDARTAG